MMPGPGSSWALLEHGEREEAAAVLGDGQQTPGRSASLLGEATPAVLA